MDDLLLDTELAAARRFGPTDTIPSSLDVALLARLRCEAGGCPRLGLRRHGGDHARRRLCDHHRHGLGHGHQKEDQPHG